MGTSYILRFDDIAPGMAWSKFLPLKRELERAGVRVILGVVPECRDSNLSCEPERADFFDLIRKWALFGDTIAQHGTFHAYNTTCSGILGINRRSEFSGNSATMQLNRLSYGKDILEREEVWQPYFMAPAHSFDESTIYALNTLGFSAITDGYGFYPYILHKILMIPQLTSFPFNIGFGYCTICLHSNKMTEKEIENLILFVKYKKQEFVRFNDIVDSYDEGSDYSYSLLRRVSSLILRSHRMFKLYS